MPHNVSANITNATLPVTVSGTVPVTGPLTNAELRAASVPVSGPLTNAELRASSVPVTGPLTNAELRASSVPVSGPLTDAQLRASPVPVSGPANGTNSGTIAALNGTALINTSGYSTVNVDVRGTFVATLTFQGTVDGANWAILPATPVGSTNNIATVTTTTTVGTWIINCVGFGSVRVIATAYTSGSAAISLNGGPNPSWVYAALVGASNAVSLAALPALAVGSNLAGDVGQQYRASATGAASRLHLVSAATTNATIVKASAGKLIGWAFANTSAAWKYVKLHNQTTTPTAGTGVVQTIGIPPNGRAEGTFEGGVAFTTGIALTTVTGAADADATAVALNDIVGDLFFA